MSCKGRVTACSLLEQGVIVYFRVVDGELRVGDTVKLMKSRKEYQVDELGVLAPKPVQARRLRCCWTGLCVCVVAVLLESEAPSGVLCALTLTIGLKDNIAFCG